MFTFLITLLTGIILGFTFAISSCWLVKVKCPQCKQPKPLKEIICWQWKDRTITGQPCSHCQRPKPQINIDL